MPLLQNALLGAILIRDRLLGRVIGPKIGLYACPTLIAGVAGTRSGFGSVIGNSRAMRQEQQGGE